MEQFIKIDYDLLKVKEFKEFVKSAAYLTYSIMRKNVWRSHKKHPFGMHELYSRGVLGCTFNTKTLADQCEVISERTALNHLTQLEKKFRVINAIKFDTPDEEVLEVERWLKCQVFKPKTPNYTLYILGKWEYVTVGKDLQYLEMWLCNRFLTQYLEQKKEAELMEEEEEGSEESCGGGRNKFLRGRKKVAEGSEDNCGGVGKKLPTINREEYKYILNKSSSSSLRQGENSEIEVLKKVFEKEHTWVEYDEEMILYLLSLWDVDYVKKQMEYTNEKIKYYALNFHPSEGKGIDDYWSYVYCACENNYAKALISSVVYEGR